MANPEHLAILKQGVEVWNKWRAENHEISPIFYKIDLARANLHAADLSGADLARADLSNADLFNANLSGANLSEANLFGAKISVANLNRANLTRVRLIEANLHAADLSEANLHAADLSKALLRKANLHAADLSRADLSGTDLIQANLSEANLSGANLSRAFLIRTNFSKANLNRADLTIAIIVEADLTNATLTGCKIYGISAWDVKLEKTKQNGLIITQEGQPVITVDNLEVAQFIYLLLNNQKIRDVINTVANKAVLILGRFGERKVILDSIADELRERNYLPIMFDFERPIDRNFRETVQTLAGLSKFVIADLTDPKSTPLESLVIFYNYKIPFLPLIQEGQEPFSMFDDFKLEIGYIPPVHFKDKEEIKTIFDKQIILPAEEKHKEIREAKNK